MARKLSPKERVQAAIREKFGEGSVVKLSDGPSFSVRTVIPSGLRPLDHYVIGKPGGFPAGRMVELFSPEGNGKTAMAMFVARECQRLGGVAIWADAEQTFDYDRAVTFGIDPEELLMIETTDEEGKVKSGEDIGAEMETAMKALVGSPGPNLLVIDSIDAIQPRDVIEKGLTGEERMGAKGKLTSRLCRLLNPLAARASANLLFINQLRDKIGVMFGETTTTPGGNAIKFYASLRLKITGGKRIEDGDDEIGKYLTIKAVKNKLDVPSRSIEARFLYASGWDDAWTTLNFAKDLGLVEKSASLKTSGMLEKATAALEAANWGRGGEEAPAATAEIAEQGEAEASAEIDEPGPRRKRGGKRAKS